MVRSASKNSTKQRRQVPTGTPAFALYAVRSGKAQSNAVLGSEDPLELLRWAVNQPRGEYELRDGEGVRLARIGEKRGVRA